MVCVQIKKSLITAHVLADSSDPIANLLELHAAVPRVEMAELALIPEMVRNLHVYVRQELLEKLANKTPAMNVPIILASMAIALVSIVFAHFAHELSYNDFLFLLKFQTVLEITIAPVNLNGEERTAIFMIWPVQEE